MAQPTRQGDSLPVVATGVFHTPQPVYTTAYKELREGTFWQHIPAYAEIGEDQFLDHRWQAKHSITSVAKLLAALKGLVSETFLEDAEAGFHRAPMSVRVSPYLLSLIDWSDPYADPLRRQFIPVGSRMLPDHPKLVLDSLSEQADAAVPGLTHRYPDKALFLPLDTCPVYCRFCTRSYAVGVDTDQVEKLQLKVNETRWQQAFDYIRAHPTLEDIVISGGDAYNLRAAQLTQIGTALLDIPHVRRLRVATKGPAVMPQKLISDHEWVDALTRLVDRARKEHRQIVVHTHFNHPNEITRITERGLNRLFERGVVVRNQSVLQRGVNDETDVMITLVKRLGHVNVQPYYVYVHDLVKGVEDLRTTVATAVELEKRVRGVTAGFNTPVFVCDAPGGGGKRDVHSYDYYDKVTGISVYRAPSVKPGRFFMYFDPIHLLSAEGKAAWADPARHDALVAAALEQARAAV